MVFSSTLFLFRFLPLFMILYFIAPGRMKNVILFLGSLLFYAWGEPVYVCLLLAAVVINYIQSLAIAGCRRKSSKRAWLVSSLIINLGVLGSFKYADFFVENINELLDCNLPLADLALPVGMSLYILQVISYMVDCYRGETKVQKNFLDFAVFVTMFPRLMAGPLVKYGEIEAQLSKRKPDILQISSGSKRFILGLAKKVLLANNLGLIWAEISAKDFSDLSVLAAWIGVVAFALQIYFDFSGYSDMAIGLGACLGFVLPENFNYPYMATGVTDFWRRWHMTLNRWFKEYVYIPLGGNRKGVVGQIRNILIVWLLIGILHGPGWNFWLWGLWMAVWLILEKLGLGKMFSVLPGAVARIYTGVVMLIGWVFFAMETGSLQYLKVMFGLQNSELYNREAMFIGLQNLFLFIIALLATTPLVNTISQQMAKSTHGCTIAIYRVLEKLLPALLLLASIAYMLDTPYNSFIYFRF